MERGGLDSLAEYWADDIDYRAAEGAIDDSDRMFFTRGPKIEPVELIDAGGDQVIAVLRGGGRAKLGAASRRI